MPPRIAIDVSPLLDLATGIGYYIANLASRLTGLKPEFQWNFFAVPRRTAKEINVRIGTEEFKTVIKPWHLPARVTSLLFQAPLRPFLAVEDFIGESDLFHWTNFLCCSQRTGKKIVTVHDISFFLFPEYHPWKRRFLFNTFFPRSLEQADHIIAVSQNTKQDLVRYFHVPPGNITVVPLAADNTFTPMCREAAAATLMRYGINYGQYLLYVGTLEPRKNLKRLLQAYHLFRDSHSECVPMVLAGANGWLNHSLFDEIDRSPWKSEIKILGYIPKAELPALYAGAIAFVYPSIYEGFGLPPLEAISCGTAVITSNNSSLPEVVGDAALLIEPEASDDIASAMLKIVTDVSLRATLRQRGLERAKIFDWRITAERTLDVYTKTLG
jgi:glycosyltransferase involved in cell wall biosynthesis